MGRCGRPGPGCDRADGQEAVISNPDIYRAAKLLLDQHGEDAELRAAERADELRLET